MSAELYSPAKASSSPKSSCGSASSVPADWSPPTSASKSVSMHVHEVRHLALHFMHMHGHDLVFQDQTSLKLGLVTGPLTQLSNESLVHGVDISSVLTLN